MTFPRAESDWLIFLLSCKRWPVAPDSRTRSDPARSTKLSFPTYNGSTNVKGAIPGVWTPILCVWYSLKAWCRRRLYFIKEEARKGW